MMAPWLGIIAVSVLMLVALVSLKLYKHIFSPHPESTRKFMHMLMGVVTLTFPWIFSETWPVWILCGLSVSLLASLRFVGILKGHFGDVLGGVSRYSWGEVYFPIAIACLFQLTHTDVIYFVVPVLILTFADAVAALAGIRFGKIVYHSAGSSKSLEGSLAFFAVAFLCTALPLYFMTDTVLTRVLIISAVIAFVVMLLEGVAWSGIDNLLIPFGAYALMISLLKSSTDWLVVLLIVIVCLVMVLLYLRRFTALDHGATIGIALMLYVTWALQPWIWLLPPVIYLVIYSILVVRNGKLQPGSHNAWAVLSVASSGLFWMFIAVTLRDDRYFLPYLAGFCAHLTMTMVAHVSHNNKVHKDLNIILLAALAGIALILFPVSLYTGITGIEYWLASSLTLLLVAYVFFRWQPDIHSWPVTVERYTRQAVIAMLATAPALLFGRSGGLI